MAPRSSARRNFIGTAPLRVTPLSACGRRRRHRGTRRHPTHRLHVPQDPFSSTTSSAQRAATACASTIPIDRRFRPLLFGMRGQHHHGGQRPDGVLIEARPPTRSSARGFPGMSSLPRPQRPRHLAAGQRHRGFSPSAACLAFKTDGVPTARGHYSSRRRAHTSFRTMCVRPGATAVQLSAHAYRVASPRHHRMDNQRRRSDSEWRQRLLITHAHDNLIGGEEVSVVLQNTILGARSEAVAILRHGLNNRSSQLHGTTINTAATGGQRRGRHLIAAPPRARYSGGPRSAQMSSRQPRGASSSAAIAVTQVIGNLIARIATAIAPRDHGNRRHGPSAPATKSAAARRRRQYDANISLGLVDTGVGNASARTLFSIQQSVSGLSLVNPAPQPDFAVLHRRLSTRQRRRSKSAALSPPLRTRPQRRHLRQPDRRAMPVHSLVP